MNKFKCDKYALSFIKRVKIFKISKGLRKIKLFYKRDVMYNQYENTIVNFKDRQDK